MCWSGIAPPRFLRRPILKLFFGELQSYFHAPGLAGWDVEQLSDHVYTFRWGWYRNIFVVTDDGVFATDPFNRSAALLLRDAIHQKAGDRGVKTLLYTHYHRDHTEGGAVLAPAEVISHERCPAYFSDLADAEILPPTRLLSGDETLTLGGLTIRLLYLGKTHTDTLFAVHVPQEGLLFTADFGLVKTFPPVGIPDFYRPGTLKAMERLAALDFRIFVPSHFGHGLKQDFLDFFEMLRYLEASVREGTQRYGRPDDNPAPMFAHVYDRMSSRYGLWHGFDQMILFSIVRTAAGQLLGY